MNISPIVSELVAIVAFCGQIVTKLYIGSCVISTTKLDLALIGLVILSLESNKKTNSKCLIKCIRKLLDVLNKS